MARGHHHRRCLRRSRRRHRGPPPTAVPEPAAAATPAAAVVVAVVAVATVPRTTVVVAVVAVVAVVVAVAALGPVAPVVVAVAAVGPLAPVTPVTALSVTALAATAVAAASALGVTAVAATALGGALAPTVAALAGLRGRRRRLRVTDRGLQRRPARPATAGGPLAGRWFVDDGELLAIAPLGPAVTALRFGAHLGANLFPRGCGSRRDLCARPRGAPTGLTLGDRDDQLALAHPGGAGDAERRGEALQLRQKHRGQPGARPPTAGRSSGGVVSDVGDIRRHVGGVAQWIPSLDRPGYPGRDSLVAGWPRCTRLA